MGVAVAVNEEPLEDGDFAEKFPEGLGTDSELASVVRTSLSGPAPGKTFTPSVHTVAIPTTHDELDDLSGPDRSNRVCPGQTWAY